VEAQGAADVAQYTGMTDDELVATGGSLVTFTTLGSPNPDTGETDPIFVEFLNEPGDGVSLNGFILTGKECTGAETGDTHVGSIQVTSPAAGDIPGRYLVEAQNVTDDSGDTAIVYNFEATNGAETVSARAMVPMRELPLGPGTWTVSVTADDSCPALADDATQSTEVVITCPSEGDTTCNGVNITGPQDNAIGEYLVSVDASDTSGSDIRYTLTATRTGLDSPIIQEQVGDGDFTVLLSAGTWSISVETDDDSLCDDTVGANQTCSVAAFEVIATDSDFPDEAIRADYLFTGCRRACPDPDPDVNFDFLQEGWEPFIPEARSSSSALTRVIQNIAFTIGHRNSNLDNRRARDRDDEKFKVMIDHFDIDNIPGTPHSDVLLNINFLQPGTYKLTTFHPRNDTGFITTAAGDVSDTDAGKIFFHSASEAGFEDPEYLDEIGLSENPTQEEIDDIAVEDPEFFFYCTPEPPGDTDGDGVTDEIPEDWMPENGGAFPADKTVDDVVEAFANNQCGRAEITFTTTGTGEAQFSYNGFAKFGGVTFAGLVLEAISVGSEVGIVPGDSNLDGGVDLSDPVNLFNYLFLGGSVDECLLVAGSSNLNQTGLLVHDHNGDGGVDLSDGVGSLNRLFLGGQQHVLGEACVDFTGSSCASTSSCR